MIIHGPIRGKRLVALASEQQGTRLWLGSELELLEADLTIPPCPTHAHKSPSIHPTHTYPPPPPPPVRTQIRSMGAAALCCLLEGPPQRAFLAIAEARHHVVHPKAPLQQRATLSSAALQKGFTTLSSSLGQAVVAAHVGLLHAACNEAVPAVTQVGFSEGAIRAGSRLRLSEARHDLGRPTDPLPPSCSHGLAV